MANFHKAERKKGKLRLGLAGPAGAGKTYSALLLAFGMGGRIAMIDTERGSGELYSHLGDYDCCTITPPFEPKKYVEAIRDAEKMGYEIVIIDSLTHAWAGQGGLLDLHGHISDKGGNTWAAWRRVTPQHNELVDALLQSSCHIIATMRSKMEYAQSEESGKKTVKKLGMSPIQRDGMEYEFTVFMDIDLNHSASSTKDRTTMFDGKFFTPSKETGIMLMAWLNSPATEEEATRPSITAQPTELQEQVKKTAAATQQPATVPAAPTETQPPAATTLKGTIGGNGNVNYKTILEAVTALELSKNNYEQYCFKRYGIRSLEELSSDQTKEQAKLIDSLKRPDRLQSFREILGVIEAEQPPLSQLAAAAMAQNQIPQAAVGAPA
ncbi:MAG: ATP-binding protein [Deltaproteobacteria bacterium]|nr:ATP-binding protein [Deltaproteobacteria bacterium]